MMENSNWKEVAFFEIANITMGQSPSGDTCNDYEGFPLLNGPTEFGIKHPKEVQFTRDSKKECKPMDILFCVRGSTTGKMNWADKKYSIGRGLAAINHKNGSEYNYFVKGVLDYNLELLLASATGSTFPNLSRHQLENLQINLPPLHEQKAIASVLSSLDDKIDLLHQQNQTLEALAETLFRQWFMEEESELVPLGECIKTTSGGTPSRKRMDFYEDGIYQWIKSKELNGGYILDTEEKITEEALNKSSAKLLAENSVLIAMYGATVGELAIIGQEATCNQAICACLPNDKFPYTFIYHTIKANVDELKSRAVGSAQQNISQVLIKSLEISVNENIGKFHTEVDPMMKKIKANYIQIQTLTQLRDTLLPKLMSGEVRVKIDSN